VLLQTCDIASTLPPQAREAISTVDLREGARNAPAPTISANLVKTPGCENMPQGSRFAVEGRRKGVELLRRIPLASAASPGELTVHLQRARVVIGAQRKGAGEKEGCGSPQLTRLDKIVGAARGQRHPKAGDKCARFARQGSTVLSRRISQKLLDAFVDGAVDLLFCL
jgi:hypothetical protein